MIIDTQAKENCYATGWSFGEICCHCGCCSEDVLERTKARIKYVEWELKRLREFDFWVNDRILKAIQEKNIKSDIRHYTAELEELNKILKEVEE